MNPFNNEYDIKPNTGNNDRHFPLLHKNISELTREGVNELDPEEVTSSPRHRNYQKQRRKLITTKNQDTAKTIVVDGHNFKFTGGKDIESESRLVKDETSDNEGYKNNNFHNVYDSLGYQKSPRRS